MADDQNTPTANDAGNLPGTPVGADAEGKTIRELREVPIEAVPTDQLPDIAKEVKQTETQGAREARRATEDTLNKPIEAIEDSVNAADIKDQAHAAAHPLPHAVGDSTVLLGYTIPLPLYTVIYFILGAITILEVLISSLPHSIFTTIPLIVFSIIKACLVVLFYMHLREDSRMFAFALALPIFIALVASIFLLSVPTKGY